MLKDTWSDKINGESTIDANDINDVAKAVIALENEIATYYKREEAQRYVDSAVGEVAERLNDYVNGYENMPFPTAERLAVLQGADIEGAMTIEEPIANNNPATKRYVDDLFAGIKLAEDGEY